MRRRDSDWPLVIGIVASALLHAGVMWSSLQAAEKGWLAQSRRQESEQTAARLRYEPDQPPVPPPEPLPLPETRKPEPPPPQEDTLRLGIDDSEADTETWIGVRPEDAGDAQGRASTVDQAAYARPAGEPDLPLIPAPTPDLPPTPPADAPPPSPATQVDAPADSPTGLPPVPAPTTIEQPETDERPSDLDLNLPTPAERKPAAEEDRKEQPEPNPEDFTPLVLVPVPEKAEAAEAAPEPVIETPQVSRPEDAPVGLPAPPKPPAVPPAATPGGDVDDQFPGDISDRESDATAIKNAIVVEPGKPVAGKGLQVKTIRPRWAHFTLITASPRNCVVRVAFNRFGKVEEASFLESTGRADVDRPILDAVYNWTAVGKDLEKLAPPEPGKAVETIKMEFRLILRAI